MKKNEFCGFHQLQLPRENNFCLITPRNFCNVPPHEVAPIFDFSVQVLLEKFDTLIAGCKRVTCLLSSDDCLKREYVARSFIFRFPDFISVELIDIASDASSIALYSRSKYGKKDFHVNRNRLHKWLKKLGQIE